MTEEISKSIAWNGRLEEYFSATGEKAHCLSYLHKQSEALYSKRRTFIDLPVIVLSGILGFLSVGSTTMFAGDQTISSVSVGLGSLFVSVLNTVGSYFQWSKRCEGHRIASIQYAKLYRFLNIEMSLPREERMSPHDLLKTTKEHYDRLQEISPLIPPEMIAEFKIKFGTDKYKDISFPEEANGLEKITVFQEEQSLANEVDTPFSRFQETPLPPPPQKSSPALQENRLTSTKTVSIAHEPQSLHIDLATDTQTAPPPPLVVSVPSS